MKLVFSVTLVWSDKLHWSGVTILHSGVVMGNQELMWLMWLSPWLVLVYIVITVAMCGVRWGEVGRAAGTGSFLQLKLWRHWGHRWVCRLISLITLALCVAQLLLFDPSIGWCLIVLMKGKVGSELYYDCRGNDQPLLRIIVCHHMNDDHYNITSNYASFSQLHRSVQIIAGLNAGASDSFVSSCLKLKVWGQRIIGETSPFSPVRVTTEQQPPQTWIKL